MSESLTQVAPDSTGKKIRNLQISAVQDDGTIEDVQIQVLSLTDDRGKLLSLNTTDELLMLLLEKLKLTSSILERQVKGA